MNKKLFDSMQTQMSPSPEVRAVLTEKLAQSPAKRPVPWKKYGALAACAALAIVAVGAARYPSWEDILRNFHPSIIETKLHSYVTAEDVTGYIPENAATAAGGSEEGDRDMGMTSEDLTSPQPAPNTGDLPGGAYVGDAPVQEGAEDYQRLMDHFGGTYPDWYGGAYLDSSGRLTVLLVEDQDPGDKSLELQVLDWTGSDSVMFSSCKYSLARLRELQEKVCDSLTVMGLNFGCGADEENNRLSLTISEVNDVLLAQLAQLDPDDDAIYVQVGSFSTTTSSSPTEDPAVSYDILVLPVPEDSEPIAIEPQLPDEDRSAAQQPAVQPGSGVSADTRSFEPSLSGN